MTFELLLTFPTCSDSVHMDRKMYFSTIHISILWSYLFRCIIIYEETIFFQDEWATVHQSLKLYVSRGLSGSTEKLSINIYLQSWRHLLNWNVVNISKFDSHHSVIHTVQPAWCYGWFPSILYKKQYNVHYLSSLSLFFST